MICAIHQPNFFPWLGYFDKIKNSDVFIIMDDVDYPKSGSGSGSWTNRVKVNIQGQAKWFTCPIRRLEGRWKISETQMLDDLWRDKIIKTLQYNYRKHPQFSKAMEFLEPLINHNTHNLSDFNINAISNISKLLGITTKLVKQSDLDVPGSSTELLINLTKKVGAETYMCGGGAAGYQEDDLFPKRGIKLVYQNYVPTPYTLAEDFIPGLSIIDYLMYEIDQYT